jgi:flagellar biosynthesis/type III secretory pathway protein FliH
VKIASLANLKKELKTLPPEEVIEKVLRVIKHKKENKELLNYLLFESGYEEGYREAAREEISEAFAAINTSGFYLAKKSVRRALRIANKYIKYSDDVETEIELLIHFCIELLHTDIELEKSRVLMNLYDRQHIRIEKALAKLHPDLQYDYTERVAALKVS